MYVIIIPLWNPLLGSFCVIKKDICILDGGLFSLSTHALIITRLFWVSVSVKYTLLGVLVYLS